MSGTRYRVEVSQHLGVILHEIGGREGTNWRELMENYLPGIRAVVTHTGVLPEHPRGSVVLLVDAASEGEVREGFKAFCLVYASVGAWMPGALRIYAAVSNASEIAKDTVVESTGEVLDTAVKIGEVIEDVGDAATWSPMLTLALAFLVVGGIVWIGSA